jgi:catechol 2,3-dioxygenase-like lactoylglutathione lyase family enzyme
MLLAMFDHVTIRVGDRAASERFYDTVLAALGIDPTYRTRWFTEWEDFSVTDAGEGDAGYTDDPDGAGLRLNDDPPDRAQFTGTGGAGSFSLVSGTPTESLHMDIEVVNHHRDG